MLFQAGSLLLVIISVYLLKRIHIFSDKSYKVVQGLVFNLTLPCAIIMSFATNKHPMNLLWLVVFGLFACLIPLFVVYFGSRGDEPRYRAYQMLNASGLNIGAFCLPVVQTFMGPSAGLPVIMLDIGNAIIATAASLTITRSLLHLGSPAKDLPLSLKIKNIAHDFYSSISFDCYMLMLVFMFAGWSVPHWIVTLITPFANANAFAAMAMIGLMMEIPDNHKDRSELGKGHRMAFPVQRPHRIGRMVPVAVGRTCPRNRGLGRIRPGDDFLYEIHRLADGQCQACRLLIDRYRGHRIDDHDDSARRSAGRLT